jgi:hypothetical protein
MAARSPSGKGERMTEYRTVADALTAAKRLIASQRDWCRGRMTRRDPRDRHVQRCAVGAYWDLNFASSQLLRDTEAVLWASAIDLYGVGPSWVNDDTSVTPRTAFRRVHRIYDEAIRRA